MTSAKQQIFDQFEVVRRQRDAAIRELSLAQETVTILEAEISALKYYGDLAYAKVAVELGPSERQIDRNPEVKVTRATAWIDDLWLCSPENNDILAPAEGAWQKNLHNPQAAILLATEALKTNLGKKDRLRCKLFLAAIQVSAGTLEPACALVNECIHGCGTDPRYKDIAGVAYYIRGRIFAAMKIYTTAHWDFSMVVLTPNYHELAKKWQGLCETWVYDQESGEPVQEDRASTPADSKA
jgi:hypothetical protein